MNTAAQWALIISLAFGSFVYTYQSTERVKSEVTRRLERIEDKLDRVLESPRGW